MKKRFFTIGISFLLLATSLVQVYANGQQDGGSTKNEYGNKLTITVPSMKSEKDELVRYVEEKFNVEYEFIPVSWNDWNEKTRLWVASGDMPDIVWWDFNYAEYVNWVKQGAFRQMPDDLSAYPSLEAKRNSMKSQESLMIDGKYYAWTPSRGSDSTGNISTCGFMYRKDWAEALGMYKEEYTWDEFIDLLTAFVEKDPGNLGSGKTIGIGTVGWGFPRFITEHIQTRNYYYEENGEVKWWAEQEKFIDAVRELKMMFDKGLIWQDQVIAKSQDAQGKFVAGEMGVYYANFPSRGLKKLRDDFVAANPGAERTDLAFMTIINPEGNVYQWATEDFWSASHFPADISDEKMERILAIWDWMNSPEGMDYQHRGVKGIDWVEENGVKTPLNTDLAYNTEIFRQSVLVARDYGITDDPVFPQEDKDATMAYLKRHMESDADIEPYNYEIAFCSTPSKDQFGTMSGDVSDKIKYILLQANSVDEAEKLYREWLKEVSPKVDKVLAEMNEALF